MTEFYAEPDDGTAAPTLDNPPSAPDLLGELVRLAGQDSRAALIATHSARADENERRIREEARDKAERPLIRAQEAKAKAEARRAEAEQEVKELRAENEHLRALAPEGQQQHEQAPEVPRLVASATLLA